MQAHAGDDGVFIRSMATRGHLGGLARATERRRRSCSTPPAATSCSSRPSASGQDEVDIVRTADVSIVTLVPGAGDEVQALKAGIMEIADIFVVNKADREGADRTVASIEAMLSLQTFGRGEWRPPIVKTEATTGKGVAELRRGDRALPRAHARGRQASAGARAPSGGCGSCSRTGSCSTSNASVLAPGEFDAMLDRIARARDRSLHRVDDIIGVRSNGVRSGRDARSAVRDPRSVIR